MNVLQVDPDVMWGVPVFAGTHVPAVALFDYLATGSTFDEFLIDFPSVKREDAERVLTEAEIDTRR